MPLAAPVTTATRPVIDRRSVGAVGIAGQRSENGRNVPVDLWEVGQALLVAGFFAAPLAISMWALLDAARRPQWAWALAERRQVVWMALILAGVLTVVGGLLVSLWYLLKIRPLVAASEEGRF
jgi:hypothetical protein